VVRATSREGCSGLRREGSARRLVDQLDLLLVDGVASVLRDSS